MASVVPELPVLARDRAFETLYRRYVRDVYHYALALLRNPDDAEDVTQTTFLNAYRAYKRGDEIRKPQNWLIKIAHNVARTRYANASRRVKEVPLEDHVDRLAVSEEDRPNVEGVLRALGRLPFNQRAAIVMRELEGRSYAEIADTLGVSVSAVETLIFRARRSLRLRSSSIRVLTTVPLPGSLAQLFEGGAVVAGGGAIAGAGFLAKAMVVLVAGVVATGVSGDKTDPATAAAQAAVTSVGTGLILHGPASSSKGARLTAGPGSQGAVVTPDGSKLGGDDAAGEAGRMTASPVSAAAQVMAAVSSVVSSATNAGTPPAVPLPLQPPTLPVEPPSLPVEPPSLPVEPPSLPIPSVTLPVPPPSVPVPSVSVPVPVPVLPDPPPLPKLP